MFATDPVFRLPPDAVLTPSITPLAEVLDPFQEFLGVKSLQDKSAGEITLPAGTRPLRFAVLDTGVDDQHRDLQGQILDTADFTRSINGPRDVAGHGTWCAGAIAARADDFGIRGIAYKSQLLCGKVLGDNGSGNEAGIAAGMKWAYQKGADVFSLSLGGGQMSESLHKLFAEISQQTGKFIFCAAGNDGGPVNYPAKWSEVIAVGAIDASGKLTQFTSRGPELDILAPGVEILSTIPGGRHGTMTGTCIAAGESVYTINGPKPIEQVGPGDTVFAFSGGRIVERAVAANHVRGRNSVYRLRTAGRDVELTSTHQVLTLDCKTKELDWVRAESLHPERHRMILPRGLRNRINPYLDSVLTEDICWLLGFFLGDGWLSYTKRGMRVNFAKGDKPDVIAKVERIYQSVVGKQIKGHKQGGWEYDDSTITAMIVECLGFNRLARDKTIPLWLWTLPQEKQIAFYLGYKTADGHTLKRKEYQGTADSFECGSQSIIHRLAELADYIGWSRGMRRQRTRVCKAPSSKSETSREFFGLNIYRRESEGGFERAFRNKTGKQFSDMGIDPKSVFCSGFSIEEESRIADVYDLTVPGADCFVTNGIVTHNSMATPIAAAIGGLVFAAATNVGRAAEFDSTLEMILALRKSGRCDGGDVCKYPVIDPRSLAKFTDPQTPPVPPAPVSGVPTRVLVFAGGKQFEFLGAREVR